jgi:5-methylthioadenosine/S-adenosylhomocysteine deaminase
MRVLIHRATNLTLDPRIGDLHVDILVEGSRSVAVAPSIPIDDAEVIAAQRMNRAAGFVDSCRHTWQSLLRGAAIDWTFEQYFAGIRGFMGPLYTPDDIDVANHRRAPSRRSTRASRLSIIVKLDSLPHVDAVQ